MTKVLNLDELAEIQRELVIGGRSYKVKSMTVEGFLAITKLAEKLNDESTFAEQIDSTITTIQCSVPDITREVLINLSLEQMKLVVEFVRGETPEGVTEAAKPEKGTGAKKK